MHVAWTNNDSGELLCYSGKKKQSSESMEGNLLPSYDVATEPKIIFQ